MRTAKASSLHRHPKREDRLDIARALYKSLVARYSDRLIILYDDRGLMLAHTDDSRDATAGSFPSEQ
jgi:hypothetical protein